MDQDTIAAYNAQASRYDEQTEDFWERFPVNFIDKFSKLAGNNVIDIGCGPGRDALILKKAGRDIICIDASQTMVNICRNKGLTAVVADLLALPFENEQFDSAWAYTSFLHLPKTEILKALKEMKRVVKTTGVFALGMIEGDGEGYVSSEKITLPRYFAYYQQKELEEIIKKADFRITHQVVFEPNKRRYLNYILKNPDSQV
ncbi:MAG: class I SAM-dependent methyltransferase [Candidatus Berkelbacteria bacterium]|nr:MAG: class I SAM-dependent methyltransferase [Candidatus Berkelbacteria bacterium]QQG51387.1 MAG: class I SAM-dependent methyltransferase [Candidatus Berkelbacteria bacterium]